VGHVEIGFDVADGAREFFVRGNIAFRVFALLQDALGFFLVLPEGGIAGLCFEGFQALAVGGNVKDNSARDRCAFSIRRNESEGLRCDHSQFPTLSKFMNKSMAANRKSRLSLRAVAPAQDDTSEMFSTLRAAKPSLQKVAAEFANGRRIGIVIGVANPSGARPHVSDVRPGQPIPPFREETEIERLSTLEVVASRNLGDAFVL